MRHLDRFLAREYFPYRPSISIAESRQYGNSLASFPSVVGRQVLRLMRFEHTLVVGGVVGQFSQVKLLTHALRGDATGR